MQVGGAVKNVLAIASGMGKRGRFWRKLPGSVNHKGLSEMRRLAEALGGYSETLSGLSGLGDVLLSCSSRQSRNFLFGELLGNGNDKHIARERIGVLLRAGLAPPPS